MQPQQPAVQQKHNSIPVNTKTVAVFSKQKLLNVRLQQFLKYCIITELYNDVFLGGNLQ